jgi:hypothetical protein
MNPRAYKKPSLLKQQVKTYYNIWRTPLQHTRELKLNGTVATTTSLRSKGGGGGGGGRRRR